MKIAILGAGRMGGWLARVLSGTHAVAVYDVDFQRLGGIEGAERLSGPEAIASFAPELLINAVTIDRVVSAFEETAPLVPQSCIISDIASIKGGIPDYYRTCGRRFVSVHPMFGPTFADMEALKGSNAIIIEESDVAGAAFFDEFFEGLGVKVFRYSFAAHDRMMAYSLTLPFLASIVFAASVDSCAVPGTTFARHLGIARGLLAEDDQLLAETLFNVYSLSELEKITGRLEYLKHIIRDRDREELCAFLERLRENVLKDRLS